MKISFKHNEIDNFCDKGSVDWKTRRLKTFFTNIRTYVRDH